MSELLSWGNLILSSYSLLLKLDEEKEDKLEKMEN